MTANYLLGQYRGGGCGEEMALRIHNRCVRKLLFASASHLLLSDERTNLKRRERIPCAPQLAVSILWLRIDGKLTFMIVSI